VAVDSSVAAPANPSGRSLLRQERSVNTRRALVRAAGVLWAERGYNETTVEDVCVAAGVGRSTYYLHFESKEQLLMEFAFATARGVAADVESAAGQCGSIDDEVAAFVSGLVPRMEATPRTVAVTVLRHVSMRSVAARETSPDQILFDDVLTRMVRAGQGRGEVRADVDAEAVGEVLAGTVLDALQRWAGGNTERTLRQSLELRFELVLAGLRTGGGGPAVSGGSGGSGGAKRRASDVSAE
jgi:AcrR family transcriptional regulator